MQVWGRLRAQWDASSNGASSEWLRDVSGVIHCQQNESEQHSYSLTGRLDHWSKVDRALLFQGSF
jgi:hypothetical protein